MSTLPPPLPAPAAQPWWRRRWKLVVAAACAVGALVIACFIGGVFALVHGAMTGSDAYRHAVEVARRDARVQAALGTPIRERWFVLGSIATGGGNGHAHLVIPLEGSRGRADVTVDADQVDGAWRYRRLVAALPGGAVDLAP